MPIDKLVDARRRAQEVKIFISIFPRMQRVKRMQVQGVDHVRGKARLVPQDAVGLVTAFAGGPVSTVLQDCVSRLWSGVGSGSNALAPLERSILNFWPTTWGPRSMMNLLALQVQGPEHPANQMMLTLGNALDEKRAIYLEYANDLSEVKGHFSRLTAVVEDRGRFLEVLWIRLYAMHLMFMEVSIQKIERRFELVEYWLRGTGKSPTGVGSDVEFIAGDE